MAKSSKRKGGGRSSSRKPPAAAAADRSPQGRVAGAYVASLAFLSGASVMIVELAASRVLAPYFGNTLYTWTAIIGVIMVALASGYYLGGRLADRAPRPGALLHLVAAAAVTVLAIPILAGSVTSALAPEQEQVDLVWGPVWGALALFAVPGCLLATVTPFAIKLLSLRSENARVGTSAGTISGLSTVGSVLGTFGAGFVLIPTLGIKTIFIVVGVVLAAAAVVGYAGLLGAGSRAPKAAAAVVALVAATALGAHRAAEARPPEVVYQDDTYYHQIRVVRHEGGRGGTGSTELLLDNTPEGAQSDDGELVYSYTRYYALERIFCPEMRRAAFLGGGAYSMPQALVDDHPDLVVEVAEIDPALEEVGRRFFRLDEYEGRILPRVGDGRSFLLGAREPYDLIFGDAYRGRQNVPSHMVTREFFELIRERLAERGVYMMNLIGALEGPRSEFFRAVAATIREVFPELYVFATYPSVVDFPQNLILVAPREALDLDADQLVERAGDDRRLRFMARTFIPPSDYDLSGATVLTDDYNPVENIVARQLRLDP